MKGKKVSLFGKFQILLLVICFEFFLVNTYNVAVVELAMNLDYSKPPTEILEDNTETYIKLIQEAKNQSETLDLIVFPESTLSPYFAALDSGAILPADYNNLVLCTSTDNTYAQFLKNLSCAAIQYNTSVVINFVEKELCQANENCSQSDGFKFYNTNVAFGSNGTIIARYRKWNLFGEIGKSKPTSLDLPVWEIQNTTFGMMTCFDIQFSAPAFNLTKHKGVKNVIFPLHWIAELPYLTALQIQQMWAQELNVVLLASGASLPRSGAGGSGIFLADKGPLSYEVLGTSGTKLMVHSVPNDSDYFKVSNDAVDSETIDKLGASMDGFYMLIDRSIPDHNSIVLNTSTNGTTEQTVCHGDDGVNVLCCHFNISITVNASSSEMSDTYVYHMAAFNGVRTYSGVYYGGVETCGVIACFNESVASCGQRFSNYSTISWPVTFTAINVTGNFSQSEERYQLPTTLLSSIRPLGVREYSWRRDDINTVMVLRNLELIQPQNRLLTFGIYGRDFTRDWDPIRNDTTSGGAKQKTSYTFLRILLLVSFVLGLMSLRN